MNSGEQLRKLLLNIDAKMNYALGYMRVHDQQFKFFQKFRDTPSQQKAIENKMKRDCYKVYIKNLEKIKRNVVDNINDMLMNYLPQEKTVWKMHFLEQRDIPSICNETGYAKLKVEEMIKKMEKDLECKNDKE